MQAANAYLCDNSILPITMSEEELQVELDKRQVYYKETESRDMLVHLLEMDILSQSQRIICNLVPIIGIKAKYVDYGVRKITAFDIFNEYYGSYTGPMLSSMLKEKGIRPPRYRALILFYVEKL